MFRNRRRPAPAKNTNPAPGPGDHRTGADDHSDARALSLAAELDSDQGTPRQPLLTEAEALVVVDLLEQLTEQPVCQQVSDIARTLIVRILDRLEFTTGTAPLPTDI